MEISPFPYQGPLDADQVRGRDALVDDLVERATARRVTALLGPRRFGKTSVLTKVADIVADGGAAVVWVDLYEVASRVDLAVRIDEALARVTGPVAAALGTIAAGLDINLGVLKMHFAQRDRPDPDAVLHARLDVLIRAALAHPTIVVFDEFSSITRVDGAAGLLRTKLQHHYAQIGLLFAGSEPSTMRTLFADRAQPFFGQADLLTIEPLSPAAVHEIVSDGFAVTGRDAAAAPGRIVAFCGGHPQRTMQLADAVWRATPLDGAAGDPEWDRGLDDLRNATSSGFERIYSSFENREKDVLRILATGGSIFGRAAEVLSLSNGAAQNARRALTETGDLVVGPDDRYQLVDPLFADWLRRRFPL